MEYEENLNESQISKPSEIKKRKTLGQLRIYIYNLFHFNFTINIKKFKQHMDLDIVTH